MASVDGEYVGPLTEEDAGQIVSDLRDGRSVLEHKQLRYRRCADPGVATSSGAVNRPRSAPRTRRPAAGGIRGNPRSPPESRDSARVSPSP